MKTFHILTLFPKMFEGPFSESMIKRAQEKGLVDIRIYDLRGYGIGKHNQVDDTPYGGGAGMVLKVDVIARAITDLKLKIKNEKFPDVSLKYNNKESGSRLKRRGKIKTILLTPQGEKLTQEKVRALATPHFAKALRGKQCTDLILICGHYEGFDERIRDLVDEEISVGDYILTGGEIPAMILVDSVVRLIPGVLGKEESHQNESFENNLLEYPQYTRPEEYGGKKVPEVLLSGDHKKIEEWRAEEAHKRTRSRRKDLLI